MIAANRLLLFILILTRSLKMRLVNQKAMDLFILKWNNLPLNLLKKLMACY